MIDAGGLTIPYHGLGFVELQVRLVPVLPGRPRASITAALDKLANIPCSTPQILKADPPYTLASMKSGDGVVLPDELYTAFSPS
jgi:hypothetical protein